MKVLTFGELLLRLAAPGYTRLLQKDELEATFCGGEANVAVSLANFGINTSFLTKLPDNDIGYAALNSLRAFGVNTANIIFGNGRMGVYYLEKGASQRPSKVIYDREYSAIALASLNDFDWEKLLDGYDWFHWTGITPALSGTMPEILLQSLKIAKSKGITVSCDLNYRAKLWNSERAKSVMSTLMPYVDVCIGNEEDAEKILGIQTESNDIASAKLNSQGYTSVAKTICETYGCRYAAFTLRESYSASYNGWSGMLYNRETSKAHFSKKYDIQIIDRVGGGDSFTGALLYGMLQQFSDQESIEFAVAASCLKHTIEGDFNRVTVDEVKQLVMNGGNGRVVR
ncbi:MAG: sugar kinase [Ruminococcus sp.]|nr:sugar kinase [Ruminococcus sp.]